MPPSPAAIDPLLSLDPHSRRARKEAQVADYPGIENERRFAPAALR
jgi:hypothetical protein